MRYFFDIGDFVVETDKRGVDLPSDRAAIDYACDLTERLRASVPISLIDEWKNICVVVRQGEHFIASVPCSAHDDLVVVQASPSIQYENEAA